jgi:hypothetical protein
MLVEKQSTNVITTPASSVGGAVGRTLRMAESCYTLIIGSRFATAAGITWGTW